MLGIEPRPSRRSANCSLDQNHVLFNKHSNKTFQYWQLTGNILPKYSLHLLNYKTQQNSSTFRVFWIAMSCIWYIPHAKCYRVFSRGPAAAVSTRPPREAPGCDTSKHLGLLIPSIWGIFFFSPKNGSI